MGRDLISRPYGRFYYLPRHMAARGHKVYSLLLDYKNREAVEQHKDGICWMSESLVFGTPTAYLRKLKHLIKDIQPDWIIGFSDTYFGIFAQHFAQKYGIHSCIDAYDNYEGYIPWMKPLHLYWRRALSRADLVTAAGPGLAEYISLQRSGKPSAIVPMSADPVGYKPMDKSACRSRMELPASGKLIGYFGSLHRNRGLETLFSAIDRLKTVNPDVKLVISGRRWKNVPVPDSAISLGYIDDDMMPLLLNSMDTIAVINKPSAFGNYSYPVKLYEAMSCQVPVAVTRTQATASILRDSPEFLVPPSDPASLCNLITQNLDRGSVKYSGISSWDTSCDAMEEAMLEYSPNHRPL